MQDGTLGLNNVARLIDCIVVIGVKHDSNNESERVDE